MNKTTYDDDKNVTVTLRKVLRNETENLRRVVEPPYTPEETDYLVQDALKGMANMLRAQEAVANLGAKDARRVLEASFGAVFSDRRSFILDGVPAKLQGDRGVVGPSTAKRSKAKAARKARRENRS